MEEKYYLEVIENTKKIMYEIRIFMLCIHLIYATCFFYVGINSLAWISVAWSVFFVFSRPFITNKHFALCFWIMVIHVCLHSLCMVWRLSDLMQFSLSCVAILPIGCLYCYYKKNMNFDQTYNRLRLFYILSTEIIFFIVEKCIDLFHTPTYPPISHGLILFICILHYFILIYCITKGCAAIIHVANKNARRLNHMLEEADYSAKHDTLTGLKNRQSLESFVSHLKEKNTTFYFCIGDVDNFKQVNDTYGHSCGDYVLVKVADIIKNHISPNDRAYRWGGEEFVIIYVQSSLEKTADKVNDLRQCIEQTHFDFEQHIIPITMTFGICNNSTQSFEDILKDADQKLYAGKTQGKNCVIS